MYYKKQPLCILQGEHSSFYTGRPGIWLMTPERKNAPEFTLITARKIQMRERSQGFKFRIIKTGNKGW